MSGKLEKGLFNLLTSVTSGRVYPRLPQSVTFPAIRYQRIYTTRQVAVDGEAVGVTEVGMQVDCMAESYEDAKNTADSVRAILHTYNGRWGELTSPETHLTCHFCVLETENDLSDIDGDDLTYWVSQRYKIWTDMD